MKRYIRSNDATYQNRRNPNKFIETRKYNDGHTVARQYMKWDTPEGEVKNYTGAKDAKRGRYFRTRKDTLDQMLEDYDEVETSIHSATDLGYAGKYYKVAKPADYEGLIASTPEEEAEYMEWVEAQLSRFNATFEGWAVARNKYYDTFANADNMELAIIGKHPDGSLSLYVSTSDHLVELDEFTIQRILDYDDDNADWVY